MLVSHSHRLIFVATPRTASRSVAEWLAKNLSFRAVRGGHHRVERPPRARDYGCLAVVREPYERLTSFWLNETRRQPAVTVRRQMLGQISPFSTDRIGEVEKIPLIEWLIWCLEARGRSIEYGTQAEYTRAAGVDFHLRYETLERELPFFFRPLFDLVPPPLPQRGRTPVHAGDWRDFWSLEAEELVRTYWAEDFELFGYDPDPGPVRC